MVSSYSDFRALDPSKYLDNVSPGRAATVVVAAVNSSLQSKAQADLVVDGVEDEVDYVRALAVMLIGGKLASQEGTFLFKTSQLELISDLVWAGMGHASEIKLADDSTLTIADHMINISSKNNVVVRDLKLNGNRRPVYGLISVAHGSKRVLLENIYAMEPATPGKCIRSANAEELTLSNVRTYGGQCTLIGARVLKILGSHFEQTVYGAEMTCDLVGLDDSTTGQVKDVYIANSTFIQGGNVGYALALIGFTSNIKLHHVTAANNSISGSRGICFYPEGTNTYFPHGLISLDDVAILRARTLALWFAFDPASALKHRHRLSGRQIYITNAGEYGAYIGYCKDGVLDVGEIAGCGYTCLYLDHCDNVVIKNFVCKNAGAGGYSGIVVKDSTHITIESTRCTDDQADITGNLASDAAAGQKDVIVDDASLFWRNQPLVISDTTPQQENVTIASIDLDTNTLTMVANLANTYTTALSAKVDGVQSQSYGIQESGASDYNTYKNNDLRGNVTSGIVTVGAHNVYDQMPRSTVLDLSGGATDVLTFPAVAAPRLLVGFRVIYNEATTAFGVTVTIRIGRLQADATYDDDYYASVLSEKSKARGYSRHYATAALLQQVIAAGESVTVGMAGSSGATGEIQVELEIVEMAD